MGCSGSRFHLQLMAVNGALQQPFLDDDSPRSSSHESPNSLYDDDDGGPQSSYRIEGAGVIPAPEPASERHSACHSGKSPKLSWGPCCCSSLENTQRVIWNARLSHLPGDMSMSTLGQKALPRWLYDYITTFMATRPGTFVMLGIFLHILALMPMCPLWGEARDEAESGSPDGGLWMDYVWTAMMPLAMCWHLSIFSACNLHLLTLLLRQFKPIYILANATIFSVSTSTYYWPMRKYWELPGKGFDLSAFGLLALCDAIPEPVRQPYQRCFVPSFVLIYCATVYPRLYMDMDAEGGATVIFWGFGSTKIANTALACEALVNVFVWSGFIFITALRHKVWGVHYFSRLISLLSFQSRSACLSLFLSSQQFTNVAFLVYPPI